MNERVLCHHLQNHCGSFELRVLRAAREAFGRRGPLRRDARPSGERGRAYGKEVAGTEQDTISSLVLGGELGAAKSLTEKPDQDSSLQGQASAFTGT